MVLKLLRYITPRVTPAWTVLKEHKPIHPFTIFSIKCYMIRSALIGYKAVRYTDVTERWSYKKINAIVAYFNEHGYEATFNQREHYIRIIW